MNSRHPAQPCPSSSLLMLPLLLLLLLAYVGDGSRQQPSIILGDEPTAHHTTGLGPLALLTSAGLSGISQRGAESLSPHEPHSPAHAAASAESILGMADAGHGRRLHLDGSDLLQQWLQNTTWGQQYATGSCFQSGTTHKVANITDFVRLIQDPTVTQIELVGNLLFSNDIFPPEYAHDISKGINVSHEVEIRACGSWGAPIIVDVNNVIREVYVDGKMTWQGTIKFINSFPSPRRAGLFALISVLSVEAAGVIAFKGVAIHGYEPSPLFNEQDPYWEVHNNSAFAPQPNQYIRLNNNTMIMTNWIYNRTAWLLASQGANGLVQSTGDGHWNFNDVLISWSPPASSGGGLQGAALALAVALPVVLGTLLLVAGAALLWWCCRRKIRYSAPSDEPLSDLKAMPSWSEAGKIASASGANSCSNLSNARVESSAPSASTRELIETTRLHLRQSFASESSLAVKAFLGEGTFGKVYSAYWRGSLVAVKTMLLPAAMSGKERREKMAIMETAISSSLSHPNIVQTYTYEVKPLTGELARKCQSQDSGSAMQLTLGLSSNYSGSFLDDASANSDHHGWEVRLVLELCDLGNLEQHLIQGGFKRPDAQHDMAALVATAMDVARATAHLHAQNIIHGDLKARNVLLKSAGADARGFVAKVSDFGLSMRIDPSETHVSNFYQGTLTHMAPEVLMFGKISFASDVYAFGIMLWEMYTAMQAFKGVPRALLGHEVTTMGRRPEFPPDCPFDYQLLACRCWESDPAIRPSFDQVLSHLQQMSRHYQPLTAAPEGSAASHLGHPANAARLRAAASAGDSAGENTAALAAGRGEHSRSDTSSTSDVVRKHGQQNLELLQSSQSGSGLGQTSSAAAAQWRQQGGCELQAWQPQPQQQTERPAGSGQQGAGAPQQLWGPALFAAGGVDPIRQQSASAATLGTWQAPTGDDLWFDGSLAPEELQQNNMLGAGPQH